ncbi:MAG: acyl-[Lachnospiraceae bacterium]|nr:acyl-[acyl-carrier-protein] thioesterase [Lachnospiraceae bacterium]
MYSFDGRVRYSETDSEEILTVPAIIDYFQDSAILHTYDLRQGKGSLIKDNCAWMLCSWQLEILRYPKFGEKIVISTWPYSFKSFLGERNCTLSTKDGEMLVKANSIWTYMDLDAQRPKKVPEDVSSLYELSNPLEMDYKPRKITIPESEGEKLAEIVVEKHHLDSLYHVNNGQYVKMALDCRLKTGRAGSVRVEYKKQARLGDVIYPVRYEEEGREIIVLMSEDKNIYATVEMM